MKLLMLKGLPASGKSTFAKKLAADGYVRVNKDDMRAMLHGGKWSKENEKQVLKIRDQIISDALYSGKSVVVDDTNFAPKHAETLKQLAAKYGAVFETKFFDVPLDECIKRDLQRPSSVGEKVIRQMHDQFLLPPPEIYKPDPRLPKAILCDIDGTLAHMVEGGRSPYDWHRVGEDTLDHEVTLVLAAFIKLRLDNDGTEPQIILLSGRDGSCRNETIDWLAANNVPYDGLIMREAGDNRKDSIVKKEIFEREIRNTYNVLFVLDDRNQVVDMWRRMGLKCYQVAPGDF